MNRDIVAGNWKQLKGRVQARWGLLMGDYCDVVRGRRTQSAGERQSAYGVIRSKSLRTGKRLLYPVGVFLPDTKVSGHPPAKAPILVMPVHRHH